jgi:transposase
MVNSNFIFVGCDLHEKTLVNRIAVNREASEKRTYGNTVPGRAKLIADLKQRAAKIGGARIVLAYEASGQGFLLCDQLKAAGIECHVLAPTKIERSSKQKRNKNDDGDAERLLDIIRSHHLAGSRLPAVWVPDLQTRDDRETVRSRQDLAEKQTGLKAQIQTLIKRQGFGKPEGVKGNWSKSYYRWLKAMSEEKTRGEGFRTALSSLLRQLEFVVEELGRLDGAIDRLCGQPHLKPIVEELDREQGVGRLTAAAYAVEVGDFGRFKRRQQIGAYWGVTPGSNESGEVGDRKGHITRQGSPRIRRLLCQAAWSRVQHNEKERDFYQRLVKRNPKRKKIALVAAMRRLSIQLWHVGRKAQAEIKEAQKVAETRNR